MTGTATLDFGAFPGASDASVAVTGQTGIVAGSLVEAWIRPVATADHTADEHRVETLEVVAGNIVAGTGFTIYGLNRNPLNEPVLPEQPSGQMRQNSATAVIWVPLTPAPGGGLGRGRGTRLYGL